jgi:acyl-coenzyme A thioesterase PaaI-like protein
VFAPTYSVRALPSLLNKGRCDGEHPPPDGVTNEELRIETASVMRELGHEFVGRTLSDHELEAVGQKVRSLLDEVRTAPPRVRELSRDRLQEFTLTIPTFDEIGQGQRFSDSIVAGAANPMGLAAQLWRDGDVACMQVTLGKAFEGAPGRAHGGVVAALLDEVMGLMNMIHGAMAYTAQLDISYLAPTPVGEPIIARAWLARQDGRKQFVEATLHADQLLVARAKALFISIDRSTFLEEILAAED